MKSYLQFLNQKNKIFEHHILDPYDEEIWDPEEEKRVEEERFRVRHEMYRQRTDELIERIRREKEERDRRINERPNRIVKLEYGENPNVGDRVWCRSYGSGTVAHASDDFLFGYNYINFDLILPDEICDDHEKNHATHEYGCDLYHGWYVKSDRLYKIIEE